AAFYRIFDRLDEILEREASEELHALRHSPQPARRKSLWSTLAAAFTNVIRRAFRSGGDHRVSAQHQKNKASREASSTAWGGQRADETRDGSSRTADLLEKLLVELQRIRSILEGKVINRNIVIDAHDGTDASTVAKAQGCCEVTGHRACTATTEQGAIVAVGKSNSEDRLGGAPEAKSSSGCHVDVDPCNLTVVTLTMSKRLVMAPSPGTGLFMTNVSGKPTELVMDESTTVPGSKVLVEELTTTKQLLTLAQRRCSRLEVEKQEHLREIELLTKRATTAEAKYDQVKTACARANHQYDGLCSDNAQLKVDLEAQAAERSMLERRYLQAKAELDQLRNESDEYKAKEGQWKNEIMKLVEENTDLEDRMTGLRGQLGELEQQRDTLVREGRKLIAEYEQESEHRLRLEKEVSSLTKAKEAMSSPVHSRADKQPARSSKHKPQV
ncbi:hypothetical protein FOZ63_030801, partial [Perkinsus olseni]